MDIQLEINGKKTRAKEGATIMQVAADLGLYIPHFCYHPKLSVAANCRMCLVEVEKSPKPLPACATVALDGMSVKLDSPRAKEAQNSVMEFLLINHPLDCPICDQGGECQLQDLAVGYGMSKSRYAEEKRVVFEKNLGPLVSTDMTRCIHCTRCVRFGREIGGMMELGMTGRGEHAEIMPFIERTVDSELSGNMIDVCPVGALTSKPFRFTARPWELSPKPGVAAHDSWGSNITWQIKGAQIKRVVPRDCEDINQCWISDRDRFSYLALEAKDRALAPLMRPADSRQLTGCGWQEALRETARELKKYSSETIGFFAGPGATCEELFLWRKLAQGLNCGNIDDRLRQRDFSVEAPAEFGFRIAALAHSSAVLFVGAEPAREQPLLPTHFRRAARGSQQRRPDLRDTSYFHKQRRRLMAVSAADIGEQVPLQAQQLARPSAFAAQIAAINEILNFAPKQANSLFDFGDGALELKKIAQLFNEAKGEKRILFGDGARGAENFGALLQQMQILAKNTGATIGDLSSGANGAGAQRLAVRPQNGGMNAAEMQRAGLKAAMLLGCEPQDFAAPMQARAMLSRAGFTCALAAFSGGLEEAHVVLPVAAGGENEGTFINGEGRVQEFSAAVPPPGEARPAWKILRVLGEMLGIPGFDFSTLEDVRRMMKDEIADAPAPMVLAEDAEIADFSPPKSGKFEFSGGAAIYDSDMLSRRASALQLTALGKNAAFAFFHPADLAECNIAEGAEVLLGDGENTWQTRAFADRRLARGVILAYPPNLRRTGISVKPASQEEAA
ncbi:MAG: NADH-quinone oxidoreductase subunit NuoG [Gammaproteobacteria bacterium]